MTLIAYSLQDISLRLIFENWDSPTVRQYDSTTSPKNCTHDEDGGDPLPANLPVDVRLRACHIFNVSTELVNTVEPPNHNTLNYSWGHCLS